MVLYLLLGSKHIRFQWGAGGGGEFLSGGFSMGGFPCGAKFLGLNFPGETLHWGN